MTEQPENLTATQFFPVDGAVDLDLSVTLGRITVALEPDITEVTVEVRHDPEVREPWAQGMSNLLNWVTERFGDQFGEFSGSAAEAVQQTRVEQTGGHIVIRAPKALPLRNIPLSIAVHAPAGSRLEARAGSADVTVTGACGRVDVLTGTGEVKLERADGPAIVRTGSGSIRLGPTLGGLQLRTGSGDVEASSLSGSATLATGTGDVWLGATAGDVMARSGSGDLSVAEAASGSLELITGSGEIRIGVRPGVTAEVDLTSSSGKVSSELDVELDEPEGEVPLRVRARTGSGAAVITRAPQ